MLNDLEEQIVGLIEEGYGRSAIAKELGVSERLVRSVIKRLCAQYECGTRQLPAAVAKGENA